MSVDLMDPIHTLGEMCMSVVVVMWSSSVS